MTHGTAMVKSFRTRNKYSATSVDQLPHQLLAYLMYGHQLLLPIPDIDRTQHLLVIGANPMASNGSLMTVPDFPQRVRELKARGGRMVVIDPRRTETAKVASEHLFVRPGTDAFLLLAMLRTVLDEGLETVPSYVDGLDAVRRAVDPFTPGAGRRGHGGGRRRRPPARPGARRRRVGRGLRADRRLGAGVRPGLPVGGAAAQRPDRQPRPARRHDAHPAGRRRRRAAAASARVISTCGAAGSADLPEFAGELPVATLADEILTPGDGQVRALLTVAGNPVSSTPDGKRLGEAIAGLDFHAAIDFYVNETTRNADVILPPTSALERDHYDLVFHVLAVRNTARFTPAVYPKPKGAMHDWEIYREVALRTARRLGAKRSLRKRLSQQARMRLSPTRTIDLLLRTDSPRLSLRKLAAHPDGLDLGPLQPCLPERLQTKDKRIDLAPQLVLDDLARLEASEQRTLDDGELLLIGRRHQKDCNSWMHNSEQLTRGRPRHHLLMHPDDLAARGIDDGSVVAVTSRVGKVEVEVAASDAMMPGVVSLPHGYGHRLDGVRLGTAVDVPGVSINDLTDPERVDVSGNAVLNGTPVTVTPTSR